MIPQFLQLGHKRTADSFCYVLPPKKIGDLFVLNSYKDKSYIEINWLIDTITTSNFYKKFKENNENDMAAQVFWAFFFPANFWAKSAQQLILTVLPFHPLYFPWKNNSIIDRSHCTYSHRHAHTTQFLVRWGGWCFCHSDVIVWCWPINGKSSPLSH